MRASPHRRVLIAAVLSLLTFGGLIIVALTPAFHGLDRELKLVIDGTRHPLLELTMRAVTLAGDGAVLLALVTLRDAIARLQDRSAAAATTDDLLRAADFDTLWSRREALLWGQSG